MDGCDDPVKLEPMESETEEPLEEKLVLEEYKIMNMNKSSDSIKPEPMDSSWLQYTEGHVVVKLEPMDSETEEPLEEQVWDESKEINMTGCKDPLKQEPMDNDIEDSLAQKPVLGQDNMPSAPSSKSCQTISTTFFSCDIAVQCQVSKADKSTDTTAETDNPFSSLISESETIENLPEDTIKERKLFINLIYRDPTTFIGLPQEFSWLLNYVCMQNGNKISELTLIVTLHKIMLYESTDEMSEQFQIATLDLTTMFRKGIECLANFFQNLIYLPSSEQIKSQLPTVFKYGYTNVQCILHCFELEIATPSDPLQQAKTWSKDMNGNTLKYLIGFTPSGFVSFVSQGYGGRITDKQILERSNLIDVLPDNAVVMAVNRFQGVESHLMSKDVTLVRPSVDINSSTRPTRKQTALSKMDTILRRRIEKAMEKLKRFSMLYPPTEVKYKNIRFMDLIVTIACGLINLQVKGIKHK